MDFVIVLLFPNLILLHDSTHIRRDFTMVAHNKPKAAPNLQGNEHCGLLHDGAAHLVHHARCHHRQLALAHSYMGLRLHGGDDCVSQKIRAVVRLGVSRHSLFFTVFPAAGLELYPGVGYHLRGSSATHICPFDHFTNHLITSISS